MNKFSLLVDVCTNECAFVIFNNNFSDQIIYKTNKDLVDVMNDLLDGLLVKNNIQYSQIEKIYLLNGPGSFTGVRAGLNLAKTIISVYPNCQLYTIDSLMAINLGHGISICDAKGNKSYLQISKNSKILLPTIMIENDQVKNYINKYNDLPIYEDSKIDIKNKINALLNHLDLFQHVENWLELEPNYIKEAL